MKEETKDTIACILIFAIPVILLVSFAVYMFFHPKIRGISYCDDNRYYMVNAITGNNEISPDNWNFVAIKKEDYDSWKDVKENTVCVVSSRNENRGSRLS